MAKPLKKGQLIHNRYRILSKIGEGGMGIVYKVEDRLIRNSDPLALKLISLDKLVDSEMINFFKHEFLLLTELKHPNLAKVYDFGAYESDYFFTSEYIEGVELFEYTEDCSIDILYDLIVQVARALDYIHSHGYIHNDIKPSNIMVTSDAQVKLIDFGIVSTENFVQENSFMGSINFVSPEKVVGKKVDRRSDLYSLGVTLYYIVTRELPFSGDSTIAVLRKHLAGHAKSPRLTNKNIPKALEYIIDKLIKKDIEERYQSAHQVIEDINRLAFKNFIPVSKELRKTYVMGGKFVGREAEMKRLKEYLGEVKSGNILRNGLVIAGEAGTGKSRLIQEFKHHTQTERFHFVQAGCVEEKSEAYGPFLSILKQVITLLSEHNPLVKKYAEVLCAFIEGKNNHEHCSFPEKEKDKVQYIVSRFLLEASRHTSFVLSISDLHLANSLTRELIDRLLTSLKEDPKGYALFLLFSYQTDGDNREALSWVEQHIMTGKLDLIPIHPLSSDEMSHLISSMLGIKAVAPYFVWKVEEITRGNPFFVTELMKALIEENVVCHKGEIWQIGMHDLSKLKMPQSILKIFYRRIKKLSDEAKKILHYIGLYQSSMAISLLKTILNTNEKVIFEEIAHLLKKQFLLREEVPGDCRYALSNERLKTLLCDQISYAKTIQYHQEIAEAIISTYEHHLYPHYESLAYHFSRSTSTKQAIFYCLKAGDKLKDQYANQEALNFYKQALELFKRKEDQEDMPILRQMAKKLNEEIGATIYEQVSLFASQDESVQIMQKKDLDLYPFMARILGLSGDMKMETIKKMAQLNALLGRFDQSIDLYNAILTDDEIYLAPEEKAHILGKVGNLHAQKGDVQFALNCFERVENLLRRIGICRETAMSKANLAHAYLSKGDYELTIQMSKQGLDILRSLPHGQPEDEQQFYSILGMGYFRKGDYASSLKCFQQNLELSQKGNDSFIKATSYMYLANVYHKQAEYSSAEECYNQSLNLFKEMGAINQYAKALLALGRLHFEQGHLENALSYQRDGLELGRELRDPIIINSASNNLGRGLLEKGKLRDALDSLQKSLYFREQSGDQQGLSNSLFNIACYYQHIGDAGKALKYFRRSLEIKEKIGDVFGESLTHLSIAKTYIDLNLLEKAEDYLHGPMNISSEKNMPYVKAQTHYITGLFHKRGQNYSKACTELNEALKIHQKIHNSAGILSVRLVLTELFLEMDQENEGRQCLYDALSQGKEMNLFCYTSQGYLLKGRILSMTPAKWDSAEEHLFRAIQQADEYKDPEILWRSHLYLGLLYHEREMFKQAETSYRNALNVIKGVNELLPEELKVDYLKDYEKRLLRERMLELDLQIEAYQSP